MLKPKFDTNFFERYAKISLTDLVDERFAGLVNRDRPDLQDDNYIMGIEVTRAIRESKNVAHALINEIAGKPVMEVSDEDWIDMTKYGYGYGLSNDLIGTVEYDYWATAYPMKRIIKNKVSKVSNGFYGDFERFGLYIFSKENLNADNVEKIIQYTLDLQQNCEKQFSTMYISQINEMFVCNLNKASFRQIEISKSQCRKFYNEAIKKDT